MISLHLVRNGYCCLMVMWWWSKISSLTPMIRFTLFPLIRLQHFSYFICFRLLVRCYRFPILSNNWFLLKISSHFYDHIGHHWWVDGFNCDTEFFDFMPAVIMLWHMSAVNISYSSHSYTNTHTRSLVRRASRSDAWAIHLTNCQLPMTVRCHQLFRFWWYSG